MIDAALIVNTSGKARLAKFYTKKCADGTTLTEHHQQTIIREVYNSISRRPLSACNFVEYSGNDGTGWGAGDKLVYKSFATLIFVFVVDDSESELGILELIQTFVETLDKCFAEVCELDLVFNWDKLNYILDEIVQGGLVMELRPNDVMLALKSQKEIEKKEGGKTMLGAMDSLIAGIKK